jgi:hypothetical protein
MLAQTFQNFELIMWKKWISLAGSRRMRRKTRGLLTKKWIAPVIVGLSGGSAGLTLGIFFAQSIIVGK